MKHPTLIATATLLAIVTAGYGLAYLVGVFLTMKYNVALWGFWGRAALMILGFWFAVGIMEIITRLLNK